jgi:hypothetical protein
MTALWREVPPEASRAIAMTPNSLRRKISKLRIAAPVTESYGKALIAREIWSSKDVWYSSQKEHWMGWLAGYNGPGAYGRKSWSGRTAEFVYNHINCPPMVLWLAEAAGVPKKDILAAKRSALAGARNRGSHCALIRRAIPWQVIEERLQAI